MIYTSNKRYNTYIISDSKWNKIIGSKKVNDNIGLKNIKFNDYSLLINEKTSTIYYSVIDSSTKYNPIISYETFNNMISVNTKLKLAIKEELTDEKIKYNNEFKVIIYNDDFYHIYNLVLTNKPILNINYKNIRENNTRNIKANLSLFDNRVDAFNKVFNSNVNLSIINNKDYIFSLTISSPGHNKRKNNISLLDMPKHNTYKLSILSNNSLWVNPNDENSNNHSVELFINNEYIGLYTLEHNNKGRE